MHEDHTGGPAAWKSFYSINKNVDGTVDVYLRPFLSPGRMHLDDEETLLVVRGVEPTKGLEDDIRARYRAWCESAETVRL